MHTTRLLVATGTTDDALRHLDFLAQEIGQKCYDWLLPMAGRVVSGPK